ncbi:hypothetical protein EhV229 [Emiliania huxleyi virus 86]|uniref:Putative membrane protein n=2 Tax=Emiliania huxleyi virus 86 TaxID=181082 RepID=Q4A2Q3_EHV8U|nr:hypothetical protein EhV229 [Emiliania huxleyi virus 86]AHA54837.1 putative membrane protein [Emiliania huxleyi virus 145]AHA55858.1 putative membrane protein [Emiliania huxleyi virus 164]CAI65653.1 putative membrane protein [Emiliania huxleyi virus 86]|tara:strand:- start:61 stop:435 length:375 start_codon:yes stop_codon:yes gene_type:complete
MATVKPNNNTHRNNNTRRNIKIAAVICGGLILLAILVYVSRVYLRSTKDPDPDPVTLDEFYEISDIETGGMDTDESSIDITDPVDPLTVAPAAESTNEIGLPGDDGPPEVDIPQHPYRIEQESS